MKLCSHLRHSGVFIVNFEQISQIVLVFPLVDFEKVNTSCDISTGSHFYISIEQMPKMAKKNPRKPFRRQIPSLGMFQN